MRISIVLIYLLFILSPSISHAMKLYICTAGKEFVSSCKECAENGFCKSHPYGCVVLKKIEKPDKTLELQNLASLLYNYKEVSKVSQEFFEDFALLLIYCDNSDEVQFVARISFMHRGEIIIKNPKRWEKGPDGSNHFVQPLMGKNHYLEIPDFFHDDIYFYIKDNPSYQSLIQSVLKEVAENPYIKEEFEHMNSFYTKTLKPCPPEFCYFFENFNYWRTLTRQPPTKNATPHAPAAK